jgi:ribosome-binding ATPase
MGLSIGIVGLPNVGKSTTFNALTKTQNAEAKNFPFCTIEPNKAIVPVPDTRLNQLARIVHPQKIVHSTIDFVDIAGLVKGASRGEGLGNQFLGNIKEVDAILHLVRCFEDENIVHVEGCVDPVGDIQTIETELILADIQTLQKRINSFSKKIKSGDKTSKIQYACAHQLMEHFNTGQGANTFTEKDTEGFMLLDKDLRFMTKKPVIYGANVDEKGLIKDNINVQNVKTYAQNKNADVVKLCAKIEEEMIGLDEEEKKEFLEEMGISESGLDQIIRTGFHTLGLVSYFTAGTTEVRAWTIHDGWTAPKAASVIHNDFEKGFIKAEVIGYHEYIMYGGESKAKEAGVLRQEGREYIVQDGDVIHFKFNV